jgi:hypothetical protein
MPLQETLRFIGHPKGLTLEMRKKAILIAINYDGEVEEMRMAFPIRDMKEVARFSNSNGNTHVTITWACLLGDSRSQRVRSLTYILIRSLIAEAPVLRPSSSSPPRLGPLLIMASTTSLPEPTFTKPITSMTLAEL